MTKSKANTGSGCLTLFSLPFTIAGLCILGWTLWSLFGWQQAQSWVETPATLLETRLKTSRSDDSDTYQATARYRYQYAGKTYESDRVSLHSGSDNLGSYQQDLAKRLKKQFKDKKPWPAYVNPSDPTKAVLDRSLRPWFTLFKLGFGLVFAAVGIGMLVGARIMARKQGEKAQLSQEHPDQPWLQQPDWAAGRIESNQQYAIWFAWGFAFFWNLISWAASISAFTTAKDLPLWTYTIILGFPVIGLYLLGWAIYTTLQRARWGNSVFEMANVPGVIGGQLAGVIHVPGQLRPDDGVLLSLTRYVRRTKQTSDGDETYDDPQWQSDKLISRTMPGTKGGAAIPVAFHIPFEQHPTDEEEGHLWKLEAESNTPGVNYQAEFAVPVFRTEASSNAPPSESDLLAEYEEIPPLESLLNRIGGHLGRETDTSLQLCFPTGHRWKLGLLLGFFGLFFGGTGIGLLLERAWLLAIPFTLIGGGIFLAGLYYLTERIDLRISGDGLTVQRGPFGLVQQQRFTPEQIQAITVSASGTRSGNTVYQQIAIEPQEGKPVKLLTSLTRRADADRLAERFREILGPEVDL
ncbi:DUF3592 domain-containing protein [Adhaeretor mobilis]|nr:DUF3592 domain-containing protein [Adhaeretor mobilis]